MTGDVLLGPDGVTDASAVRAAGRRYAHELAAFAVDRDATERPSVPDLGGGELTTALVLAAAADVFAGEIVPALIDAAGAHGVRLHLEFDQTSPGGVPWR